MAGPPMSEQVQHNLKVTDHGAEKTVQACEVPCRSPIQEKSNLVPSWWRYVTGAPRGDSNYDCLYTKTVFRIFGAIRRIRIRFHDCAHQAAFLELAKIDACLKFSPVIPYSLLCFGKEIRARLFAEHSATPEISAVRFCFMRRAARFGGGSVVQIHRCPATVHRCNFSS